MISLIKSKDKYEATPHYETSYERQVCTEEQQQDPDRDPDEPEGVKCKRSWVRMR
ncbi:hypothetical protein E2C01_079330 [Portunus trituberculatus]|uniref:Uncharacterized protein n=1 Tax=Portunus trituberculatus TaxID=210409 RepID=A0A5B7IVB4_PORTR|nr:hypothetical protein [Portunus trituberculatus]